MLKKHMMFDGFKTNEQMVESIWAFNNHVGIILLPLKYKLQTS